ncbi:TrkH family potassium uptake protein [Tropicimonas sp. TH_r6]|uniref:TrkH family potassium uptake protein n=1 Tax=Tropicimonas sp. TH_r6 TaxID=3082085 RepID=UPI0029559F71|nr:TrkH family potassium uptake protein [Tropicimonas sp. TH_r6]MDV7143157.1 TrkH family potassium uptake protein [Tropicimonas sp. TH_r6]
MGRLFGHGRPVLSPPILLASLYLALIICGSLLLSLPISTTGPISLMQAVFTATSAVTVTGLALVDTGSGFSVFGQVVILALIQVGGLGLMTFAVLLLNTLGHRLGASSRQVLREDLKLQSEHNLPALVRAVARIALLFESLGALVLSLVFIPELGPLRGAWFAIFHSVSAFCNAGFALRTDSLSAWAADPIVNATVPALFVVGGLGLVVIKELAHRRSWRHLSLHSKLMLTGTLGLTLWGFASFAALEWSNPGTLGPLTTMDKLVASWFQAVTPRTAGFSTLDLSQTHDATSLMMIVLMVVGGGSSSTAGGIKVTTLMVLLLATLSFFQRTPAPRAFGRHIGQDQLLKVLALTSVSIFTVMFALLIVSISHDGDFLDLAFEIASAFGTVGLSRGATAELDTLGRSVVMVLMFAGRVGPLTFGFLLATRSRSHLRYPEGQIYLG